MIDYPEHIIQRFWSLVQKDDGPDSCWLWQGKRYKHGYGYFCTNTTTVSAHRFSYMIQYGPIPRDMCVLHKPPCPHRHCVKHLYLGTYTQNEADKIIMGTSAIGDKNGTHTHPEKLHYGDNHWSRIMPDKVRRGEKASKAKLTQNQVLSIRDAYSTGLFSQRDLARIFNVDQYAIWAIVNRKSWKHV